MGIQLERADRNYRRDGDGGRRLGGETTTARGLPALHHRGPGARRLSIEGGPGHVTRRETSCGTARPTIKTSPSSPRCRSYRSPWDGRPRAVSRSPPRKCSQAHPRSRDKALMIDNGVTDVRVGYGHVCARFANGTSCGGNGTAFGGGGNVSVASRQMIGSGGSGHSIRSGREQHVLGGAGAGQLCGERWRGPSGSPCGAVTVRNVFAVATSHCVPCHSSTDNSALPSATASAEIRSIGCVAGSRDGHA
jgi:hypothetical protein